jgi:penicillin amidase
MLRLIALSVALSLSVATTALAADQAISGLREAARVTVDAEGISHVHATNDHDLYFMQGWVHAGERLFQMDYNRRLASGTLAELVGVGALASDVQMRTIGLRRAAERSYASASASTQAALQAYAEGVNARRIATAGALPPEYGAVGLKQVTPWDPVDTLVVGKLLAFLLSFELDTARTVAAQSYMAAGGLLGFDGKKLFSEDLWRSAAFEPNATVPDASRSTPHVSERGKEQRGMERVREALSDERALRLMREYLDAIRDIPIFQSILNRQERGGSNLWAVSGELTQHGRAMIANDPHLPLGFPSTFYPMGLELGDEPVFGSTLAGVPGVIHGYNRHIAWGSTNNAVDVTDTFEEQVVPDPGSPSGLSTMYQGVREPLIPIPQTFLVNVGGNLIDAQKITAGIPSFTLIMPRRDRGPIIQLDSATGKAYSVQYVGFGPTQEVEAFLLMNRSRNVEQFKDALQRIDVGSQNFVYGDVEGNIAYFTSGEIPVREDLQAGMVSGTPPWLVRNGQGGNEWLPVINGKGQPNQATPHEILPVNELPYIVNPRAGYLVNANNDPAGLTRDNDPLNQLRPGGGIYYMAYQWNRGFRAARIESRLRKLLDGGNRRVSFKEMQAIQGDVILRDAEIFTPYIVKAFDRAASSETVPAELRALALDAGVAEAIGRLRRWDGTASTGIVQGYDFRDKPGELEEPSEKDIASSVAASVYAAWRSSVLSTVINGTLDRLHLQLPALLQSQLQLPAPIDEDSLTALRNLVDHFESNGGKGASGVDFFAVPGMANAADRRDFVLLSSLRAGLDMLSSPAFAPAFNGSKNQNDYRWGLLHRVVLAHPLGDGFSVPTAGGAFPQPLAGLSGIPVDGGFQTVDAATHNARGKDSGKFMFDWGPAHRMVVELRGGAINAEDVWPGGTSGVVGNPGYVRFLERWLTNETMRLSLGSAEVARGATSTQTYLPVTP